MVDLVTEAFRDCNIITEYESPSATQYVSSVFKLNGIVAGLQATGIHVWTESEAIVFLQPYQSVYVLGCTTAGVLNANSAPYDQWIQAYTALAAATGATTLNLQTALGIQANDVIGVQLAAGPLFWTTVVGAPAGNVVTLAAPLPSPVNVGAMVADYLPTAPIVRPLKIPTARCFTYAPPPASTPPLPVNNIENPMTRLSRQEYMDLPQKLSPGVPTQFYYSPQQDRGLLYVWPVAGTANWAARITWYRPLQDFFAPNNTMDFPQEWTAPLRYLLADELKLQYAVPEPRASRIKEKAAEYTQIVSGWDRDSEDVQFGLDFRWR